MSSTSASSISSACTSTSSDWWCGGSGQVKWLTDVVAGGKSNDWLMQWYGNVLCLALVLALSLVLALALALALALTDDVVAVGKSNDWLMQWYSNALCLALVLALSLALALALALASARDTSHLVKLSLPNILKWCFLPVSKVMNERIRKHPKYRYLVAVSVTLIGLKAVRHTFW